MLQLKAMQKIYEQMSAEDGEYASHILRSMRPAVIRPIMTQQADTILGMNLRELLKSLAEEIKYASSRA